MQCWCGSRQRNFSCSRDPPHPPFIWASRCFSISAQRSALFIFISSACVQFPFPISVTEADSISYPSTRGKGFVSVFVSFWVNNNNQKKTQWSFPSLPHPDYTSAISQRSRAILKPKAGNDSLPIVSRHVEGGNLKRGIFATLEIKGSTKWCLWCREDSFGKSERGWRRSVRSLSFRHSAVSLFPDWSCPVIGSGEENTNRFHVTRISGYVCTVFSGL